MTAELRCLEGDQRPGAAGRARSPAAADGRLSVDFRLWDVYAGDQLFGTRLTATPDSWRTIAHQIADAVYQKLTGEKGYFDTRVVFVAESGPKTQAGDAAGDDGPGRRQPAVPHRRLGCLVFAPRFSAKRQEITYMVLRPTGASIYLKNLDTGREEVLGNFPGMTMAMAPRFSPDDSKVAFAGDEGRRRNIYVMDLASHGIRRLTDGPGHRHLAVVFARRRPDRVQFRPRRLAPTLCDERRRLRRAHRISFGAGRYTAPVWSPDGKLIAFVKQEGQSF